MSFEGTRDAYDTVAESYAATWPGLSPESPLEIALIDRFASDLGGRGGRVTDVGCGTGRVTEYLHGRGLDIDGIDLSPGMLEVARAAYPQLTFSVGSMLDLPIDDASRAGILAWYSTIHLPLEQLPTAYSEFARVLEPGGLLLLGFHAGDGVVQVTQSYGHDVDISVQLFDAGQLSELLVAAGFAIEVTLVRAPVREKRPQGYLLASKLPAAE